jgi:hypothetical protein
MGVAVCKKNYYSTFVSHRSSILELGARMQRVMIGIRWGQKQFSYESRRELQLIVRVGNNIFLMILHGSRNYKEKFAVNSEYDHDFSNEIEQKIGEN